MCNPISITPHLIDFLDEIAIERLVRSKDPEKTPFLDLLNERHSTASGAKRDDSRLPFTTSVLSSVDRRSRTWDSNNGKENKHGEIVDLEPA